jgi:hypothetical protein
MDFAKKLEFTSLEIIWRACDFGPFRAKNAPMMKMHPSVKQMANFWGATMIIGRKTVKAIMMKNTPDPIMREKDMMDCRDGTKVAAEETLVGSSRTPFVTLSTCSQHHCSAI